MGIFTNRKIFRRFLFLTITIVGLIIINKFTSTSSEFNLKEAYTGCLIDSKESKEKGECLQGLAAKSLNSYSTKEIEAIMLTINNSYHQQWCHEFMHYVGWELFKKTDDLYEAFTLASDKCDSGMYHGVAEKYIETAKIGYKPKEFVEQVIPNSCEKGLLQRNLPVAMKDHCYHGLGHAFMFITDNNLNESLEYCDYLLDEKEKGCYTGVFMENTISKQVGRASSHTSKTNYDLNNPDYPCNQLNQKYKEWCYIYKGASNILFTNVDIKRSVLECAKVTPAYQDKCFWGVGMNIPGPHIGSYAAAEKCNEVLTMNTQAYEQCILGAMTFLVQLNLGNANASVEFCNAIKQDYKHLCYSAAGKNLGGWTTSEQTLEDKCEEFLDPEAVRICLNPKDI